MLARMHRTYRGANRKAARFARLLRPILCDVRDPYNGPRNWHGILPAFLQNDFIFGSSLVERGADSPVVFVVWLKFLPSTGPGIVRYIPYYGMAPTAKVWG